MYAYEDGPPVYMGTTPEHDATEIGAARVGFRGTVVWGYRAIELQGYRALSI